jgi:hypothetical protein
MGRLSLSAAVLMIELLSRLRIVAYVRNPFCAKDTEVSKPMPLELPVTMATF